MDQSARARQLAAIGLLQEPVRRRLYDYVASRAGEVSRNQAAEAVGVQRNLAAFHLDKLADAGLLEVSYRRLGERRGPGAGRPAKLYRRATDSVEASLPPRDYQVVARLLARTVQDVGADQTLFAAARRDGEAAARDALADHPAGEPLPLDGLLAARGYEPYRDDGKLRLRNCPFEALAREYTSLVCGMNLSLIEGLVERLDAGTGHRHGTPCLDPGPGRCCVAVVTEQSEDVAD